MGAKTMFANRGEAEAERDRWKKLLPEIPSAYVPSGKLPGKALALMTLATPVGAVAGAVAGLLVAWLANWAAVLSLMLFEWMKEAWGVQWCLPLILPLIIAFFGYFLMYLAIGTASGVTVGMLGKFGRNRNPAAAGLLGAVSGLAAAWGHWYGLRSLGMVLLDQQLAALFTESGFGTFCLVLGFFMATMLAAAVAVSIVEGSPFCERCGEFTGRHDLKGLSIEGAVEIAGQMTAGNIAGVSATLEGAPGGAGKPVLYACPGCGCGFLEMKVEFEARWPAPQKGTSGPLFEELSTSWRAASRALTADEAEMLKAHKRT